MRKVFYNKTTNHEILDLSNKKTLEQIKAEFGEGDYLDLEFDEKKEKYKIKPDKIEKELKVD